MESLFTTITKNIAKPTDEQQQALKELEQEEKAQKTSKEPPIKDIVARWQKNPTDEDTAYLLKKMNKTINAAMTSYAPGHSKDLGVKAARLTLDALKTYNPSYGTDPSTHVFHNLKRLNRYANRRANIIPISEQASQEYRFLNAKMQEFIDTFDREPSDLELADITGYSLKKVNKILDGNKVTSDSSTINPDSHTSSVSTSDLTDQDFFEYVYRSVGPIDQKIMEWSTGAHGKPPLSNIEIAKKLKVTPAAISQRRSKILAMISEARGLL